MLLIKGQILMSSEWNLHEKKKASQWMTTLIYCTLDATHTGKLLVVSCTPKFYIMILA